VTVRVDGQPSLTADLVVGADGIRSTIRSAVAAIASRFTGWHEPIPRLLAATKPDTLPLVRASAQVGGVGSVVEPGQP
jgi:2-polyprenyl-6-methoxyphenol hydroxylase-like FAD-dependent oxidoreductase